VLYERDELIVDGSDPSSDIVLQPGTDIAEAYGRDRETDGHTETTEGDLTRKRAPGHARDDNDPCVGGPIWPTVLPFKDGNVQSPSSTPHWTAQGVSELCVELDALTPAERRDLANALLARRGDDGAGDDGDACEDDLARDPRRPRRRRRPARLSVFEAQLRIVEEDPL
jgi:hypothetical protein